MRIFSSPQQLRNLYTTLNLARRYCVSGSIKEKQEINKDLEKETINKLERLSLLDLKDKQDTSVLRAAIHFAECIRTAKIDEAIEPMHSPFEEQQIPLREDKANDAISRQDILRNAVIVEEEYFVAPYRSITKQQERLESCKM